MKYKHSDLTDQIIKSYYTVFNELGYGFLEKVYENAMLIELQKTGLQTEAQKRILVYYKTVEVGNYFADLLIEDKIIVELKAAKKLKKEHEYQLINYLKATDIEVGLLFNFGKRPEFKRKIFSNRKTSKPNQ
ncbi:MAG: GxxExxY protein [Balneola sp.]